MVFVVLEICQLSNGKMGKMHYHYLVVADIDCILPPCCQEASLDPDFWSNDLDLVNIGQAEMEFGEYRTIQIWSRIRQRWIGGQDRVPECKTSFPPPTSFGNPRNSSRSSFHLYSDKKGGRGRKSLGINHEKTPRSQFL